MGAYDIILHTFLAGCADGVYIGCLHTFLYDVCKHLVNRQGREGEGEDPDECWSIYAAGIYSVECLCLEL